MNGVWQPLAYVFVQGLVVGLVLGFVLRRLNKAIAALLGFSILAINVIWFARMMGIELPIPEVNEVFDSVLRVLPFTLSVVKERFGSLMPVLTSLPFIGGLLAGAFLGFRFA